MIRRWLLLAIIIGMVASFAALGVWQLERRAWKHDLIARVARNMAAPPIPAMQAGRSGGAEAYRRVTATGRYLPDRDTFVRATSVAGYGYWVMTPLLADDGTAILVNRGFVAPDRRTKVPAPPGIRTVTGLLRLTEAGGTLLRANDPAADRWYSRDVAAIATARGLRMAPFFIDADAVTDPAAPVGGLTQVAFPDNHLSYALTWFALAALLAGATAGQLRRRPD